MGTVLIGLLFYFYEPLARENNWTITPKAVQNIEIQEMYQILFCKMLKNKWYHAKVLLKRFHLNGHTIGFHPQTQKLEQHYMSPLLTLGVKEG